MIATGTKTAVTIQLSWENKSRAVYEGTFSAFTKKKNSTELATNCPRGMCDPSDSRYANRYMATIGPPAWASVEVNPAAVPVSNPSAPRRARLPLFLRGVAGGEGCKEARCCR